MEQFVLGVFQEHLSKFIIGFRKEQVNANLLNGKGEIKNVELNCAIINDYIAPISPYIELESVHVSKVSFQVSSWANLRKSPIIIDVEHVTASLVEPLHFSDQRKRRRVRQIMKSELLQLIKQGIVPTRGAYNLFDRILDNLTIEISSVVLTFQTWGKFKTRREGPWTPPKLRFTLFNIKFCSVNEFGQEAPAQEIWRHNHRGRESFIIFKKLEFEYDISLQLSNISSPVSVITGNDNAIILQVAIKRKVKNAEILAVQIDATIPRVEVDIPAKVVPVLAHTIAGLKHCFSKDRAFSDPLKPTTSNSDDHSHENVEVSFETSLVVAASSVVAGRSDHSHDQSFSQKQKDASFDSASFSDDNDESDEENVHDPYSKAIGAEEVLANDVFDNLQRNLPATIANLAFAATTSLSRQQVPFQSQRCDIRDRPILLLPNGVAIHESLTFSVSIHDASVRGTYNSLQEGFIQVAAQSVVAEAIWPTLAEEKGGYLQASVLHISVQERYFSRVRTIFVAGRPQNGMKGLAAMPTKYQTETKFKVEFPTFVDRSIRPDPLSLRYAVPAQAFSTKTTSSVRRKFNEEELSNEEFHFLHEISVNCIEITFDVLSWSRAVRFAFDERSTGFDPRWNSGNWNDILTSDMFLNPLQFLNLRGFIQPSKQIDQTEVLLPSSNLFNMTACFASIDLRLPAAQPNDFQSCDIKLLINEIILEVSSALPRMLPSLNSVLFMSGEQDLRFPDDSSDLIQTFECSEGLANSQHDDIHSQSLSNFRLQLTVHDATIYLDPVIGFKKIVLLQQLLSFSDLTMICCLESETSESHDENSRKATLFTTLQSKLVDMNVELDLVTAAVGSIQEYGILATKAFTASPCAPQVDVEEVYDASRDSRARCNGRKSFTGGEQMFFVKQLRRCQETGGLNIALYLKLATVRISLWRQNVPIFNHLCYPSDTVMTSSSYGNLTRVLLLMRLEFDKLGIGLETKSKNNQRHVVMKNSISKLDFLACNVTDMMEFDAEVYEQRILEEMEFTCGQRFSSSETISDQLSFLVSIFKMDDLQKPNSDCHDILMKNGALDLRFEGHKETGWSCSLALESNNRTILNINIGVLEYVFFHIVEALSMPMRSKTGVAMNPMEPSSMFPGGTIGNFLLSFFVQFPFKNQNTVLGKGHPVNNLVNTADVYSKKSIEMFIPADVHLISLKYTGCNVMIKFPSDVSASSFYFGYWIKYLEFSGSYCSATNFSPDTRASSVVALSARKLELSHNLKTCQCVIKYEANKDGDFVVLVDPFEVGYAFANSKVHFFISPSFVANWTQDTVAFCTSVVLLAKSVYARLVNVSRALIYPCGLGQVIHDNSIESHVGAACACALRSVRYARELVHTANKKLIESNAAYEKKLHIMGNELDKARQIIFKKEIERLGAFALVASRVCGWLRIGSSKQSGQRDLRSWNLLPRWSILRDGLILTFQRPGEFSPVDIITLEGATLKSIEGGQRKRDIKRAFAIVEMTGVSFLVVASTDKEYSSWVQEIQNTANIHMTEISKASLTIDGCALTSSDNLPCLPKTLENLQSTNELSSVQERGMGRSITRAVLAARATGQAVSEFRKRNQATLKESFSSVDHDKYLFPKEEQVDSTSRKKVMKQIDSNSTSKSKKLDMILTNSTDDNFPASHHKRLSLRNRFAGVGLSTRSRFGTAIQAAKEKSLIVAQNTRSCIVQSNSLSDELSSTLMPASEDMDSQLGQFANDTTNGYSCPACTFLNDSRAKECSICNTVLSAHTALIEPSFEQLRTFDDMMSSLDDGASERSILESSEIFENVDDCSKNAEAGTRPSFRLSVKEKLGSSIENVRGMSQSHKEPNKDKYGSQLRSDSGLLESSTGSDFGVPENLKLHAVTLGNRLSEEVSRSRIVLKRLEGCWSVRVSYLPSSHEEQNVLSSSSDVYHEDFKRDATTSLKRVFSNEGFNETSSVGKDSATEGNGYTTTSPTFFIDNSTKKIYEQIQTDISFNIQLFNHGHHANSTFVEPVSFFKTLSQLLIFHTKISESVANNRFGPQVTVTESKDFPDKNILNSSGILGVSSSDVVALTGKMLDGLLQLPESSDTYKSHCAKVVSSFLNAVLDCPFPDDSLSLLVEFLQLPNLSTVQVDSSSPSTNVSQIECTDNTIAPHTKSLSFTAGALASLRQAEKMVAFAGSISASYNKNIKFPVLPPVRHAEASTPAPHLLKLINDSFVALMEERDEAHAKLVATSVFHLHEKEQQQKLTKKLTTEVESLMFKHKATNKVDNKFSRTQIDLQQDSEAEMLSLCQQLASEIAARTSATLEILRLQEMRKLEREQEACQRLALESDLDKTKELLANERMKTSQVFSELKSLRQAFKMTIQDQDSDSDILRRNSNNSVKFS